MNNIEGQLNIDLYPQRKNSARVKLSSTRPLHATKIFIGKTPQQVLSVIPLLFSICSVAQSRAALTAIEQNLEIDSTQELETAREMLVLVENAKEHLFRLFIDWPKLFNLKNSNNELPYLSQMLGEFQAALFQNGDAFQLNSELNTDLSKTEPAEIEQLIDKLEQYLRQHVFCQSTKSWLEITDIHALHQWAQNNDSVAANSISFICDQGWASQGLTDCAQLPALDEKHLLKQFNHSNAEQFIAEPQWQGHCFETTTLTRQFEQPLIQALHKEFHATLITRWVARLVELASIPDQLRTLQQQLISPDDGDSKAITNDSSSGNTLQGLTQQSLAKEALTKQGLAQIEAARGRLIHRVSIEQGVISQYQILAPTEWNFHPQGLLAKSLSSISYDRTYHGSSNHSSSNNSSHKHSGSKYNSTTNNQNNVALEQLAHLMINAIDPCVGYQLRIH